MRHRGYDTVGLLVLRCWGVVLTVALLAACNEVEVESGTGDTAPRPSATGTAMASGTTPTKPSGPASAQVPLPGNPTLHFKRNGKAVASITRTQLSDAVPPETWQAFDPYYNRPKRYRALPLQAVLERGFGTTNLQDAHFVLEALDGYQVPISGKRLLERGGYIAIQDVDVAGWEPIGPQQAKPGPFYLVWRETSQHDLTTHPRPWQLSVIAITPFAESYPQTVPTGGNAAAQSGFAIFREQCIRCHAINREGGKVGPELNVPRSVVDYRPVDQIRAYIRNPLSFRYGNMPANPQLSDADLDNLVAYFRAMSSRKHDPKSATPH